MTDSIKKALSPTEIRDRNAAEEIVTTLLKGSDYGHLLQGCTDFEPVYRGRQRVVVGGTIPDGDRRVEVLKGRTPEDKPLIRDSKTKRRYKGSGRYGPEEPNDEPEDFPLTVNQALTLQKATGSEAMQETVSYRQAFESLLKAAGDAADKTTLAYWFDQAWQAAEGSPQAIDCPHPELHKQGSRTQPLKHIVTHRKDGNLIFKMIELAVGKAQSTVNVNINEKKLVESLEHRVVTVQLQSLDSGDIQDRIDMIKQFGYMGESHGDSMKEDVIDVPSEAVLEV